MVNSIGIGTSINLLFGYRPVWNPSGTIASPFFLPVEQPLQAQNPITTPSQLQYWSGTPVITLHESAQSLVSMLYDYDVLSLANVQQNIDIPSGPLSLGDADALAALSEVGEFLGIDFSNPQKYMLVTYERCVSTTSGDYTDGNASRAIQDILTPAAAAAFAALPKAAAPKTGSPLYDSKITLADAREYLAAIGRFGTHFVTKVFNGDKILQVFIYDDDAFKYLQAQFALSATKQADGKMAVSGVLANSWVIYTSPAVAGQGFAAGYGALTTIGRDPALAAAIADGKWADGYVPDGTPSIFAASKNYSLLAPLDQVVPYSCQLTPLAQLLTSSLIQGPWDRLVAGGLMQKFGDAVVIPLRRPLDYDWAAIFPQATDSWASGIVTPVVDIYQERVDLAQVKLSGAEIIGESYQMQSFSCFAQVLQATAIPDGGAISLPSDSITLIAQVIDTTQSSQTPVLQMSATALQQMTVACQDMYGAMIFQDMADEGVRKTALDGFLLESSSEPDPVTNRYTVALAGVLTDPPGASVLEGLSQSVEFSVVAGESLLQAQGPSAETVRGLEVEYLNWLARIIPADTTDPVLANARVRALYLANSVADFGSSTVFVPYVTYDSYAKYVGDLVTQATALSGQIGQYQAQLITTVSTFKVMNSIAAVNDNVRAIGGVLTQYFQALANGRNAMDQYYQGILNQLDGQLQATLKNIVRLQEQLGDQQALISNLGSPPGIIQQFEKDYVEYEKDEVFQAVMGIVTGLFSLGVAFAGIPGAAEKGVLDALEALEDVYDKLQSVMEVISKLSVIEQTVQDVAKINELASSMQAAADAGTLEMPSAVDIQMIPNNVEAALAGVPQNGSLQQDKANLIAAVKNLSIVGSALLSAQAQASQLLVEIANTQRLKTINGQQQAQMSGLVNALHLNNLSVPPDLAKIDLIGMTGQLQFQLKQVLSTLAKVLVQQNGALQFTYFGEPVPITSFSLNQLLAVISQQDASIINAIQDLNPQPQSVPGPVTVKIGSIPYKELINGRFKRLSVHLSEPGFQNYVMVRIDRVVPRVSGVKSTASGNYEIALDTNAQPFLDRDQDRGTRTFASTQRVFGPYVYNVATGAAEFGTGVGTFADSVTHLTPFTDWNICFPAKSTNRNIEFDDLFVDIELDFYVTAIYNDPVVSLRQALMRAAQANPIEPMALFAGSSPMAADLEATIQAAVPDSTPSLAYLEGQMYQNQNVLNGWDAAFSMISEPVNAFLNQQFQAYLKTLHPGSDSGLMTISASYFGTPTPVSFHGQTFWTSQVTKLDIDLTNPLLQFVASADQATVQQFIESGSVTSGSVDVNGSASVPSTFIPGNAYLPSGPLNFTVDLATNELVIPAADVLGNGLGSIYLKSSGNLPAPLQTGDPSQNTNEYFIVGWATTASETRIKLSADPAGTAPIVLTDAGNGVHTLTLGITWSTPSVVDTSKSPYVFANVQLSTIQGIVEPPAGQGDASATLTVTLDFPTGSFVLRNIHVNPPNWDPAPNATQISDAIANYYAQNEIKFIVQTINTTNLASDPALTPSKFVLHAMNTNAGNNVLQLLIATTGKVQNLQALALTEPVAYDPGGPVAGSSDLMVSLMISPQVTFQNIFVDSFNRGSTNFFVAAVPPSQDFQAWSATMSSGTVNAPVPFKDSYQVNGTKTQFRISEQSNNLIWDISGLTFSRTQTDGIALSYSNGTSNPPTGGTTVNFQYRQYVYAPGSRYSPGYYYWTGWSDASATAYVTMAGTYPLEVTNVGTNQEVGFSTTNPQVNVDKSSDLKPTGACECNDNDIKIALMSALSDAVPAQLQQNMQQISFKPLSVMALESLLFPANQLISMSTAKVPSAALVVGSFLAQVRQKSSSYTVTIPASAGAMGTFGSTSFESGTAVNSATMTNRPAKFVFTYGPIDPSLGNPVDYTIDIEKGTVTPPLIAAVYQPDTTGNPQNVTLLLPGYGTS